MQHKRRSSILMYIAKSENRKLITIINGEVRSIAIDDFNTVGPAQKAVFLISVVCAKHLAAFK